MVSDF